MPSKQAINAAIAIFAALPAAAQVRPLSLTRDSHPPQPGSGRRPTPRPPTSSHPRRRRETNGIQPNAFDVSPRLRHGHGRKARPLYMPGLIWSYPGTSIPTPSTFHNSPAEGTLPPRLFAPPPGLPAALS
ncbi:MAG: hypothetical protein IPJ98_28535 [Bryobacterales bacterium]|nr:hypothetical protein [Bryobacterales bacterium]